MAGCGSVAVTCPRMANSSCGGVGFINWIGMRCWWYDTGGMGRYSVQMPDEIAAASFTETRNPSRVHQPGMSMCDGRESAALGDCNNESGDGPARGLPTSDPRRPRGRRPEAG